MAVNQVTVNELFQLAEGSKNISVQALRTSIDYANRKIVTLQKNVQNLKSAFVLTLQNINRNLTKEDLDKYFSPDRYQTLDPTQVIKPYDTVTPDPDPRVNWVRRRLEEMNKEQKKELYRLENEIKEVSSVITQLSFMRDQNIKQLAGIQNANIISARDNIARIQYETIYALEEISKRYHDLSTDSSGNRIHSSSPPITRQYQILQDTFRAYASRDPDVNKGNLHLLLEDPGCPENMAAIKVVLDQRRAVLVPQNVELPSDIKKFTEKMSASINDSFISQNISRQATDKRIPAQDNAVTSLVDNADKMLGSMFTKINNTLSGLTPKGQNTQKIFGLNVNAIYDSTGFSGAVTNWFNRVMKNNYDGIPFCNETETGIAQAKDADNANKVQAEGDASLMVADQFTKAAKRVTQNASQATIALNDALAQITAAVKEPSDGYYWEKTLLLGTIKFVSLTAHDGKVLNQAGQAADKGALYRNKGDITEVDYQKYIKQIQTLILTGTNCVVSERSN
jgi:hypothetical protein